MVRLRHSTWGLARWLYRLEGRRVRRVEKELAKRAKAVTVVSNSEAALLHQFCPGAEVHAIPNGVDLEYFQSQAEWASDGHEASSNKLECVFVGALDYFPNVDGVVWFSRNVWPEVRAPFPEATFTVVGRRPVATVLRLACEPGINIIGEVADVRSYLQCASVVVVPLRVARGIQNKVLEALSAGKPVIASPKALMD